MEEPLWATAGTDGYRHDPRHSGDHYGDEKEGTDPSHRGTAYLRSAGAHILENPLFLRGSEVLALEGSPTAGGQAKGECTAKVQQPQAPPRPYPS